MNQIKKGNYFIGMVCFIFITTVACKSSNNLYERNYFINKTDFYNDTLNLTGTFPEDIQYYKIKDVSKQFLKKDTKPFKSKNLLLYGKAQSGYNLYLFYEKNKKGKEEKSDLIINDFDRIAYRKKNKAATLTLMLVKKGDSGSNKTMIVDGKNIMDNLKYNDSINEKLRYGDVIYKNLEVSNALYLIDKLDRAPVAHSKINEWGKFEMLITVLSNDPTNERYLEMLNEHKRRAKRKLGKKADSLLQGISYHSNEKAIDKIKLLARENNVVMLNEWHWRPSNRILAAKLLKPLKEEGYKYLAVEAVSEKGNGIINQKLYPLKSSGYYIREPYFGLFIREAKKLGYKIVSYDHGFSPSGNREKIQAENIANIFNEDANAKVFVYAGMGHILEKSTSRKWMAEHFKEMTGIDPLTIDQVQIIEKMKDKILLTASKSFKTVDKVNTNVDYFLINNITPDLNEMFTQKELSIVTLNLEKVKKHENEQLYLTIYYHDEYEKNGSEAIPILKRITKANELELTVPNMQKLQVEVVDKDNNIVLSRTVFLEQ